MTDECSEPKRECPWGSKEWKQLGGTFQALEDQGREIGEIKKSVSDTNQLTREQGVKLDATIKMLDRRSPRRRVKTVGTLGATAGGGGLVGLFLYEWAPNIIKAILAKFGGQ